ncbi:MAG: DUF4038 domain-containing protein [Halothermotrichaceae bacterium]
MVNADEIKQIHIWEPLEIELTAENTYTNPYTEVDLWVELEGPDFKKRVYGFWDGENSFKIRITAIKPGKWTWVSGSNQSDIGLNGKTGEFEAVNWSKAEKKENPCRRGFIKTADDNHTLEYADGTPYFLLGDTWWAAPTYRFKWYDDNKKRPIGPEMGFKDMVRYRKSQGFNCIAMIAGHPAWANDGKPVDIHLDDKEKTVIRSAWQQAGTDSAEDMYNEGGRPFKFPGKVPGYEDVVPDFNQINPEYFQHMDKKIEYLNKEGFIPFIEAARRDISQVWKKFYDWPTSYMRYIQYIFSRYHANNCILSPIHFDFDGDSIPSIEYNQPINMMIEKYGRPPFTNMLSTNAHLSTYRNYGGPEHNKWLDLYTTGNWREHDYYWFLTEVFNSDKPKPALNGEPYYPRCELGWPHGQPPTDNKEDDLYCRSGMYGSVLSGGLAGYIYGAQGLWEGAVEKEADYKMWDSIRWESGEQLQYLRDFVLSEGERYKNLRPDSEYISPNKAGDPIGYKGWAYCAGTRERDFFLLYFEKDCPAATFRGTYSGRKYKAWWYNPRNGEWREMDKLLVPDPDTGLIDLPSLPTNNDWAMKMLEV